MTLYRGDALEILPTLKRGSAQLIAFSPPYNVGWNYAGRDDDRLPLADYQAMLANTFAECHRVLRRGGVLAVNLPQTIQVYSTDLEGRQFRPDPSLAKMGRKRKHPKPDVRAYPIYAWAAHHVATCGLWLPREPFVWLKSKGMVEVRSTSTAIGAYSNPWLRPCHEMVILASKGSYRIPDRGGRWPGDSSNWGSYLELCKDVWPMSPGRSAPGLPLAWPDELAERLVRLFSNPGDLVLDPFAGSGKLGAVAIKLGRRAAMIERVPSYWGHLEFVDRQQPLMAAELEPPPISISEAIETAARENGIEPAILARRAAVESGGS